MIDKSKLVRFLENEIDMNEQLIKKYKSEGNDRLASKCFTAQWENTRILEMVHMGVFDKEADL